jgi:hypothetical protein
LQERFKGSVWKCMWKGSRCREDALV